MDNTLSLPLILARICRLRRPFSLCISISLYLYISLSIYISLSLYIYIYIYIYSTDPGFVLAWLIPNLIYEG